MADILTEEDYKKILQNRFNDEKIEFIHAEVKPISENVEGFLGEHYQVIITYKYNGDERVEPFFMKTKPRNELQAKFAKLANIYEKEIFQYSVLHKEFKKYGYDVSFAAHAFYFIPDQTIVMQDMTKLGYELPERQKYFDVVQLKCLLKSLALYHGAGFAYEQTKSKELNRSYTLDQEWSEYFNEIMYRDPHERVHEYWEKNLLSFHSMIDLLAEDESYKKKFHEMLKRFDMREPIIKKTELAKTCGHGDLWSNNMLFTYQNNIPVNCCLVDFQVSRYFYPSYDVLLAIFCNTSSEFRTKYLTEMCEYYYDTLSEILHNYGYSLKDKMSLNDFYDSVKLVKVNAMIQYLMTVSMVYLPKETLTAIVNNGNLENVMYKDKIALNKDAFNNDYKFKKVVSDALYDLHDALLDYQKYCT